MWNARRRSIESVPFKREIRICSSSCSSRCADHLKLSLVSLKTTINFQAPEILLWSIYVCVTETRCTCYGALKKFLWKTPQAQGSGFCKCKKSRMWRRGVSCKMRWLWIRFPSKVSYYYTLSISSIHFFRSLVCWIVSLLTSMEINS